jgi:hypothetical protein
MRNKNTTGLLVLLYLCFVCVDVRAVDNFEAIVNNFRSVANVTVLNIKVPSVLEVSLPVQSYSGVLAVYDKTVSDFVPNIIVGEIEKNVVPIDVASSNSDSFEINSIADGNYKTYKDFDLPSVGTGVLETSFLFAKEIRSDSIKLSLGQYVALPQFVTIKAKVEGGDKVILSKYKPTGSIINFKETTSGEWKIILEYSQPIRINEITISNLNLEPKYRAVRFFGRSKS